MASMVFGSIGSSLLGPLGGMLGSMIGGAVDQMLFGGDQNNGKLEDLTTTRADPGVVIPIVYGADRIPGIVCASSDLIETKNKKSIGVGSLFGKGAGSVTYTYHVDIDYMLCEGPILGIGRIWADGNLVRGTRYEMEISTAEHPENIGGIPYPNYYRDHLYQPSKIPWTTDRGAAPHNAYDDGKYYRASADYSQMIEITAAEATHLLDNTKVPVYWKDTSTGYFIPVTASHAYTGERPVELGEGEYLELSEYGNSTGFIGDDGQNGALSRTIIDLHDYYDAASKTLNGGGFVTVKQPFNIVASNGMSNAVISLTVEFYEGGNATLIDSVQVGSKLSSDTKVCQTPSGHNSYSGECVIEGVEIPAGARFLVYSRQYALVFPVFANFQWADYAMDLYFNIGTNRDDLRDWQDYWNLYSAINDWSPKAVLAFDGADNVTVYHGQTYQPPDPTMAATLGMDVPGYVRRAHVVFDTLQLDRYSNRIPQFTFEVVQYDDVRVADVVTDLMDRAEVDQQYWDVSAIPSSGKGSYVHGYTIASESDFRAAMEAITDAFRIDVAEVGNSLLFRPRDRERDYTVDWNDLAAVEAGKKLGDPVRISMRDPVELPRHLTVRFRDPERGYQPNTAFYRRQQGLSVSNQSLDIGVVTSPAWAKLYARNKMRDLWFERTSTKMDLPHKYVYIYPTDIIYVDGTAAGKDSFAIKVTTVTRGANGILEIEGLLHETSLYVPAPGEVDNTDMDNSTFRGIGTNNNMVPFTYLRMFDLPPLVETNEDYGSYVAMSGGPQDNWGGAALFRSFDNGANYDPVFAAGAEAIFGTVVTQALGDAVAEYIDYDSVMYVKLLNPARTLASVSADELFRGENAAIVGNEVIQFKDAVETAPGIYRLSTFLRGRRGTDIASDMAGHYVGEKFTMLQLGAVRDWRDAEAYMNATLDYRAVTFGGLTPDFPNYQFTNTGRRLKPLAPNHITGVRDASNNVTITWRRRDRVYQAMHDGADIRNSEDLLQFEVDILSGATVVRTFVVNDATSVVYSAADQTADGLTPGDPVTLKIYQMSAAVGRGNEGAAVV